MKRVLPQKTTPSERELDLIKIEIVSFQNSLDKMKKEKVTIEKEIESRNIILGDLLNSQILSEEKLKKSKILLSEIDKELLDLNKRLGTMKSLIGEQSILNEKISIKSQNKLDEINDSIKNLENAFEISKMKYGKELDALKKDQELLSSDIEKSSKLQKELQGSISLKQDSIFTLDKIISDKKNYLEKMKFATESYTGIATNLRSDINELEKKKEKSKEDLSKIDSELIKVENEKEKLLIKTVEIKESNVKLAERESILDQKEQKIKELYKRAGLNYE